MKNYLQKRQERYGRLLKELETGKRSLFEKKLISMPATCTDWLKEHKMPATAYTFEPATESKKKRWPTISSIPSDLTIKLKTYIY